MFCKNCGKEHDEESKFCAFCGTEIKKEKKAVTTIIVDNAPKEEIVAEPLKEESVVDEFIYTSTEDVKDEYNDVDIPIDNGNHKTPPSGYDYLEAILVDKGKRKTLPSEYEYLVAENKDFYLPKFERYLNSTDAFDCHDWNWPAFLFGAMWLAYRKAYLAAVLFFIAQMAIPTIIPIPFCGLIINILFGAFGTYFYYLHLTKVIQRAKEMPEPNRNYELKKKSGTSWAVPAIMGGLWLLKIIIAIIGVITIAIMTMPPLPFADF